MKKIKTNYKFHNAARSINRLKRRLKFFEKKKRRRKRNRSILSESTLQVQNEEPNTISPPKDFSFINNTNEVLDFINRLKKLLKEFKIVLVDLSQITNLTNDSIVLLLAFINNPHIEKNCKAVKANYPKNPVLRKILIESGIFSNVSNQQSNYILTRKNKKADGVIAEEVIRRATKALFGKEGRCPGIYRALMESMANTCYHAKPNRKAYETWWLTIYHNQETKCISFAFIDIGVGIFKSRKMRDFMIKLQSIVGLTDNKLLLKDILEGKMASSTNLPYRGKGLPAIYQGIKRNYYSNLKIISNDVKADPNLDKYETLQLELNGTFLYWELKEENLWLSI